MTDEPLIAGPLYGLRTWRVVAEDGVERLAAPHRGTVWPPGEWLVADCGRADHPAPAPGCDCGVHGWHPGRSNARAILAPRGMVTGVVEADGETEVHADGFRAARGRVHAIFLPPGRNTAQLERLAATYGVEAVPVRGADDIVAWCRERRLGLDDAVVAGLLGPDPAPRRLRRHLVRATVAAVIAAAVVAGVIALDPGQQHGKVINGRSGEVRVP